MFHRDPGTEEDLTSEQTFAWPSGFRDRRSQFGRPTDPTATASASASSSSSPFGNHKTAQRKSSDHVIQSLRDELDKHRQMFFDRLAPQWESTAQRVRKWHLFILLVSNLTINHQNEHHHSPLYF